MRLLRKKCSFASGYPLKMASGFGMGRVSSPFSPRTSSVQALCSLPRCYMGIAHAGLEGLLFLGSSIPLYHTLCRLFMGFPEPQGRGISWGHLIGAECSWVSTPCMLSGCGSLSVEGASLGWLSKALICFPGWSLFFKKKKKMFEMGLQHWLTPAFSSRAVRKSSHLPTCLPAPPPPTHPGLCLRSELLALSSVSHDSFPGFEGAAPVPFLT